MLILLLYCGRFGKLAIFSFYNKKLSLRYSVFPLFENRKLETNLYTMWSQPRIMRFFSSILFYFKSIWKVPLRISLGLSDQWKLKHDSYQERVASTGKRAYISDEEDMEELYHTVDVFAIVALSGILSRLLSTGTVLVATSNHAPRDLNQDGMQKEIFEDLLARMEEHCEKVLIGSKVDYRRHIAQSSIDQHQHKGIRMHVEQDCRRVWKEGHFLNSSSDVWKNTGSSTELQWGGTVHI